ncbi:MAG: S-layer homology domain-containing protein, partial [Firmicutes bacterium]|nr:S-layer homology domain-containing protein [Bacillota bacterium]
MSKKIVAMLMAVGMAFSLLPVTAFAADTTPTTKEDKLKDTATTVVQETAAQSDILTVTKKVEGLALGDLSPDFTITVTQEGTTTTRRILKKAEGTHTVDGLTWTISDLPPGTYTVSEENADVTGYDYTATYSATDGATAIVNSADTVQNQSATDTQASQKVTVTPGGESTMTVTNTYTQKVEPPTPANPVKLDVSRSKIASGLTKNSNGDWTTDVTLSLPSAEYKPVIDVVFILDDSYAGNEIFKDAATSLLTELSQKENVDVNVGIVNFDAVARDWVAATTNSQYSGLISVKNAEGLQALNTAIATKLAYENDGQTKKVGATNIEWPLEMAQNMLASGKGTEKYAILFSDMYGYVYRGDLKIGETTYENVPLSKRYFSTGGSLSMGTKYTNFADVYAHRNDEENQTLDGFFRDSSWDNYWGIYSGYTPIPTNPVTADNDPFHVSGGYSGFEKSTCLVYDRLLQMKQAGINLSIVNNDFTFTDGQYIQPIKNGMLDELGKQGICVIKTQEKPTADEVKNVFATLKDQLIQVVSAGSTVTDQIGTKFDFVGLDTMTLKIGGEKMVGTIDKTTNTITFKHGDKNDAHVVAYDSDANSFQWTINEDVTKDARVQLTYTVKLTNPQTAAGTYGVTDLNGDGTVDGTGAAFTDTDQKNALYTNESATMVPKDSNGTPGKELTFPKPSVSYTIKVEPPTPANPVTLDVSRSKIASGLTKNSNGEWTTDVTLSLPSAEEKLQSDVVFVLDKSSCKKETAEKAQTMLTQLQKEVKKNKSNIRIGVVVFGGNAKVSYDLSAFPTTQAELDKLTEALIAQPSTLMGGTNMHAGLLATQNMLKDSTTDKNRQYVILISDGLTRLFTGSDGKTKDIYYQYTYLDPFGDKQVGTEQGKISPKDCVYFGMIDEWTQVRTKKNPSKDVRPIPYNTWEEYFNKVTEWVKKDADTYALDYETYGNDATDRVKDIKTKEITDSNFKYIPHNGYENHAMCVDRAVYEAYNTFKEIADSGNHCYAVLPGNGTDFGKAFMGAMNSYAKNTDNVDFGKIGNDILYAVDKGSTVTDIIGSKFNFESIKSLIVGKQELTATKSGENTWYFGNDNEASESNYRFKVVYNSQKHQFVWTINESVSNFAPVQLTYTVKLTKPETAAGTYGVNDLNGDGKVDGTGAVFTDNDKNNALYTNESATMVPKDSNGTPGKEELTFPKPSVSYTISSDSSGSHSGGSRPSLNTKDHYGYIIGYPVDYYTGQPTTDQTKKPVRPEGKITRAEVATIYFRMLTDESRTKFWSQNSGYSDVKTGDWFNNAVSTLSNAGIIAGYEDGSFRPNGYITRAEFATIAARFFDVTYNGKDLFPDISGHWAKDYINQAANKGFVNGY